MMLHGLLPLHLLVMPFILMILGWPVPKSEGYSKLTKDSDLQPTGSHSRFAHETLM